MSGVKAIVLLSGGQDSVTSLYWAKEKFKEVCAISFNYNQKHSIELQSAKKIAELANIEHEIINIPNCLKSTSPLVSDNPLETYSDYEEMNNVIKNRQEITFVPMRNALFLTIAANRASYYNALNIVTGICEMDGANFDDCKLEFLAATEKYINTAIGNDSRDAPWIHLYAPLLRLSKAESIKLAQSFDGAMEAMAFSHTCYAGEFPPCGKCHSCLLRAEGFKLAGVIDPILAHQ